jgi:hypothetical protein
MAYIPLSRRIVVRTSDSFGQIPTTSDLDFGEIGINTDDGKMYIKRDTGVVEIVTPYVNVPQSLGYTPVNRAGDTLTGFLNLHADPQLSTHAATKQYVDSVAQGLHPKQSVRAATTANLSSLSGLLTIDTVTLNPGDRILVKDQTTGSQNGIYIASAGAWSRATDFDGTPPNEVESGNFVFVQQGSVNGGSSWVLITPDPITIGVTSLTFTQFSGGQTYGAGAGLSLSGNTFSIASNPVIPGTGAITVPIGNQAQRPGSPTNGMIRFNTDSGRFEFYEAGTWINFATGTGSPGGSNTAVQYNNNGDFGGSSNFTWNIGSNTLTIGTNGTVSVRNITGPAALSLDIAGSPGLSNNETGYPVNIKGGLGGSGNSNTGNVNISTPAPNGTGVGGSITFETSGVARAAITNTGAFTWGGSAGTSGQVLKTNGSGSPPSWSSLTSGDISTALGYNPVNRAGDTMTGFLTLNADPTSALHAATKQYVDEVASGITVRPAVKAATTTNLSATYNNGTLGVGATLNLGPLVTLNIDGVITWSQDDGILVKNQTNAAHNGRYYISQVGNGSTDWILTRSTVCDQASEIPGSYVFVQGGSQVGTGWVLTVADPTTFVVGTDAITVTQFSATNNPTNIALNDITAATTNNTISNGSNEQVWNWQLTSASAKAFTFGESAASVNGTSNNQNIIRINTVAASTAAPLYVNVRGGSAHFIIEPTGAWNVLTNNSDVTYNIGNGTFQITGSGGSVNFNNSLAEVVVNPKLRTISNIVAQDAIQSLNTTSSLTIGGANTSNTGTGGNTTIQANAGVGTGNAGGNVIIRGGTASDGNGGNVSIQGRDGVGTSRNGGNVTIAGGQPTSGGSPGTITFTTDNTTRLVINANGAWNVGGNTGTAGQVLTSNGSGSAPTWQSAPNGTPVGPNGSLQYNNSGAFGGASGLTTDGTNLTISGNLTIAGTTRKIIGDFTNATPSNRTLFQTSTPNSETSVGALPSGVVNSSSFVAWNESTLLNTSFFALAVTSSQAQLDSSRIGSGSFLPIVMRTSNTERVRIDPDGNVVIGVNALATNATNGFLYIPTMPGVPTGTPSFYSGKSALVLDTTNDRLYAYDPVNSIWVNTSAGTPSGSNQQVQFNNNGAFGASANFTWNNSSSLLTVNGTIDMVSYRETSTAPTISSGTLTIDMSTGTVFNVTLNANITTLNITNSAPTNKVSSFTLIFTYDATPRSVTWPASVKWPSNTVPTLTNANGAVDIFTFFTLNNGTTWFGVVSGQNYI